MIQADGLRGERRRVYGEEDLWAIALRTKPGTNTWLCLSPRLSTLRKDAFDYAPAILKEIHQYLSTILYMREKADASMLQLMQDYPMSMYQLQPDALATRAEYEMSHTSLISCYPMTPRQLLANFVRDIIKLTIGFGLALYVTFGHESFVKGPVVLFTQELTELRLNGLLTLLVMTYA